MNRPGSQYPNKSYVVWKTYVGSYEPSEPKVVKGFLNKFVSVVTAKFQQNIDDLHKGAEVDLDRKKKEPSEE